jgi:hypothetical protein
LGYPTDQVYLNWHQLDYYDMYVAENNALAFNNTATGPLRYTVSNFGASDLEVYDVTDPYAPARFVNTTISPVAPHTVSFGDSATGARRYFTVTSAAWLKPAGFEKVTRKTSYFAPVDLLAPNNAAEYIIITHRDFWAQAETLARYRTSQFRVALVDVQQIYDQFNGGLMSAESIRDFLAYAHANWQAPAPAYVLLMGDGTTDMRRYRTPHSTYIPPFLYLADPDLGETAADNRFVTFLFDDPLPDMHLGRFPVNTPAQAQTMVDKTIQYELDCQCDGLWERRSLFVADDLEGGGGDFYAYSDRVADGYADEPANTKKLVPANFNTRKLYLGQTCDLNNPPDAAQCRSELVNSLNGERALFVSYVGHGTLTYWASEHLFDLTTNAQLSNSPCLPIMLPMTCTEGSWHDFETAETVAEAAVRRSGGGAVASFSPTGLGLVTGHDYLEKGVMLAWFHRGIDRLGPSTSYAKRYLYENSGGRYHDMLDTFGLLGDPALQVKTEEVCLSPTAVTLERFDVSSASNGVRVEWQTADESEIMAFAVLRDHAGVDPAAFVAISGYPIMAAQPGLAGGASYTFLDSTVAFGQSYRYRLEVLKLDGTTEVVGLSESGIIGPRFTEPPKPRD